MQHDTPDRSHRQPPALYYAIAVYMWEYFSYYGMRSLLVLYLTQSLMFTDDHAYALYGAYTALVYVTPIIGGMIADRFLGYYWASLIGAAAMVAGHLTLGLSQAGLYLGLGFIICGYGLFKTNIACLLGMSYERYDKRRDSGFALMYVGGNIGAFLAPLLCAWAAQEFGWHYGFLIAAIGMSIGLLIFLSGRHHFSRGNNPQWIPLRDKGFSSAQVFPRVTALILLGMGFFALALYFLFAGWLLAICGGFTLIIMIRLFLKVNKEEKKSLLAICLFMVFGLVFWAFDQQGGSSITLFIERNVTRSIFDWTIPAASFQSINPFAILIGGFAVSFMWKFLARMGISPRALTKIAFGMVLLTASFFLIMQGAYLAAATNGHASMGWVIAGLFLMGVAELFVDPVALAEITRLNPAGSVGFLAGVYMLVTGATANYLAAVISSFTSLKPGQNAAAHLTASAGKYYSVFSEITIVAAITTVIIFAIVLLMMWLQKRRSRSG